MQSRLIIARHGQSLANERVTKDGKLAIFKEYGDKNVPLSQVGLVQAANLGETLNLIIKGGRTRAFSSTYRRAMSTMNIALSKIEGERSVQRVFSEDIREKEYYGLRNGEGKDFYKSENSETSEALCRRVSNFTQCLLTLIKNDITMPADDPVKFNLVFAHGESMRALHYCLTNATPDDYMSWKNPWNCGVYQYLIKIVGKDLNIETLCGPNNFLNFSV